jgi:Protein of unknown function (DUF2384)
MDVLTALKEATNGPDQTRVALVHTEGRAPQVGQPDGDQLKNAPLGPHRNDAHTPPEPTHTPVKEAEDTKTTTQSASDARGVSAEVTERLNRLDDWRRRFLTARRLDERLRLLSAFGITDRDVAAVFPDNATPRTIRRWRTERVPETRLAERWAPVDDLCAIIGFFLADGSYDEASIISWLRSRQPELGTKRPLDMIREDAFDEVLEAAESALSSTTADESETLAMRKRTRSD